jgi:hypothetical protein
MKRAILTALLAFALPACGDDPAPGGTDSGADADSDSGADSDSDTDSDADGGLPPSIALVQYDADSHFGDYDANLANLTALATDALADAYAALGVDAIILSMDWDHDPLGSGAAATWFVDCANDNDVVIYAEDVSPWDGTGKYVPGLDARERNGLPDPAIGIDGVFYHALE